VPVVFVVALTTGGPLEGGRGPWWEFAVFGVVLGLALLIAWLWSTAQVFGTQEALVIDDVVVRRTIERSAVAGADGDNGLVITLIDGQVLSSVAYGESVLQNWIHSSRYRKAAAAISAWAGGGEPSSGLRAHVAVVRSMRPVAVSAVWFFGGTQLYFLVLWVLAPSIARM